MKIKKIFPLDISNGELGYKEYRKIIKPALKQMLEEHNSLEHPTDFLIKTNYEFHDFKGKKMALIIIGDQNGTWKLFSKQEVKDDKRNTCFGSCYAKKNSDGSYSIVILPEKGAAKKNLMKKQIEKFAFKGLPFDLTIAAGGELEEDNADEIILEEIETDFDESNDTEELSLREEQLLFKEKMNERLSKMFNQINKIKVQLKIP
jgi:hypothetical protein